MVRAAALAGTFVISFSAIFAYASGASPDAISLWRAAYALPVLGAMWLWTNKRDHRGGTARLAAIAGGVFLAIDLALWHRSFHYIGTGLSTILANLQVLLVAVLAWFLHRERPTRAGLVALPLSLVGVALATGLGRTDAFGADPVWGATLAVGSAVAYTGFLLLLRYGAKGRGPPAGPLLDATLGTAIGALVIGALLDPGTTQNPTWPMHGWLLALAVGPHVIGWWLLTHALPRLPALATSILLLLQPVLTVIWGVILFTERPSAVQWLGVLLVLAALALVHARPAAHAQPPVVEAKEAVA